jgi:hypothetical protein
LYHTSADVVALALQVAASDVAFAPSKVPEVGVQVGLAIRAVAVAQVACDCTLSLKNKNDNRKSVKTLVEFFIQNWISPKVLLLLFFYTSISTQFVIVKPLYRIQQNHS